MNISFILANIANQWFYTEARTSGTTTNVILLHETNWLRSRIKCYSCYIIAYTYCYYKIVVKFTFVCTSTYVYSWSFLICVPQDSLETIESSFSRNCSKNKLIFSSHNTLYYTYLHIVCTLFLYTYLRMWLIYKWWPWVQNIHTGN